MQFYFVMFLVYATFAGAWGWLCYKHVQELLPIQVACLATPVAVVTHLYFSTIFLLWLGYLSLKWLQTGVGVKSYMCLSSLILNSVYYRYLNAHGKSTASTVFLIVGQSVPPTNDCC